MGCTVVERAGALNDGSALFTTRLRCGSRRRRRASLRARVGRAPLSGGKRPVPFRRTAGVAPAPPVRPGWRSALSRPPARSIDQRRTGEPPWTRTQHVSGLTGGQDDWLHESCPVRWPLAPAVLPSL